MARAGPGGVVRASGGHPYKPASIRDYEAALRLRAYPALGDEPLDEISRADLQELVDEMVAEGLAPTTIETTINAVRAIYRHEIGRDRHQEQPDPRAHACRPAASGGSGSRPRPRRRP